MACFSHALRKRNAVTDFKKNTKAFVPGLNSTKTSGAGMYKIGDLIIYGSVGVCRVTEIAAPDFSYIEKGKLYYVLEPLYQSCVIYTPIDNKKVFMRPIITAEVAENLIDMIPLIQAEAYHCRALRQLTEHYESALNTHNCEDLIELTMSIYEKKQFQEQQKRKFGTVDERFLRRAEELLFGEFAVALGMPRDKVPDYIALRVDVERRRLTDEHNK